MRRIAVSALALACVILFSNALDAAQKKQKNQMVKGTIKSVDIKTLVLVVSQKVKNENVDRELSILPTTEIVVTNAEGTKEGTGKLGMLLLEGLEGSSVQVKCDKDVAVLKVTVKAKK